MVNFSTPPASKACSISTARASTSARRCCASSPTSICRARRTRPKRSVTTPSSRCGCSTRPTFRRAQAVAARLAPHACAPRSIMLQLARDVLEVAEPVLRHSPVLTPADCEAIIAERGPLYAEIIARRGRPVETPAVKEPAAVRPTPPLHRPTASPALEEAIAELKRAKEELQSKAEVQPKPETGAQHRPQPQPEPDSVEQPETATQSDELCELFFAAGSPERRLILHQSRLCNMGAVASRRRCSAPKSGGLKRPRCRHNTRGGDPRTRACARRSPTGRRAASSKTNWASRSWSRPRPCNMPADVLQRMLLFMNPRVGQSVDRVYELAALYSEISVEAARRLIAILRSGRSVPIGDTRARSLHGAPLLRLRGAPCPRCRRTARQPRARRSSSGAPAKSLRRQPRQSRQRHATTLSRK